MKSPVEFMLTRRFRECCPAENAELDNVRNTKNGSIKQRLRMCFARKHKYESVWDDAWKVPFWPYFYEENVLFRRSTMCTSAKIHLVFLRKARKTLLLREKPPGKFTADV